MDFSTIYKENHACLMVIRCFVSFQESEGAVELHEETGRQQEEQP